MGAAMPSQTSFFGAPRHRAKHRVSRPARFKNADSPHDKGLGALPMQTTENVTSQQPGAAAHGARTLAPQATLADYKVIRRNGSVVSFEPSKIAIAVTKAFLAVNGGQGAASARVRERVETLTQAVVRALVRSRPNGGTFHIEDIQDQVELALMRAGEHNVARAYVLYREKRAAQRAHEVAQQPAQVGLNVNDNGIVRPLDLAALHNVITAACDGLGDAVSAEPIVAETVKNLYDGVPLSQVYDSAILAARTMIEKDPAYSQVTARLLLHTIRREILGEEVLQPDMGTRYAEYFPQFLKRGVEAELLDEKLLQFDLKKLDAVRPLLSARARTAHRNAAGVLHAGGDGARAERNRS
ncbi:hypothetical protein DFQ28_001267 [Apophysomyces sp. BC1034]|nr:hypothetical protein DFQ28_001267 [Apophysomyces sp. BC1034]